MFNTVTKWKVALFVLLVVSGVWVAYRAPYLACVNMFFAGAIAQEMLDWHLWNLFCAIWHDDQAAGMMFLEKRLGPKPVRYAPPSIVVVRRALDPSATHCCTNCDNCVSDKEQTRSE